MLVRDSWIRCILFKKLENEKNEKNIMMCFNAKNKYYLKNSRHLYKFQIPFIIKCPMIIGIFTFKYLNKTFKNVKIVLRQYDCLKTANFVKNTKKKNVK